MPFMSMQAIPAASFSRAYPALRAAGVWVKPLVAALAAATWCGVPAVAGAVSGARRAMTANAMPPSMRGACITNPP
jgi:hypothetical protein